MNNYFFMCLNSKEYQEHRARKNKEEAEKMDVKDLLEGDYIGVQLIKDSPTKRGVILSGGIVESYSETSGKSLKVLVEIDGKQKFWRMNKTSLHNFAAVYGYESRAYVGKIVIFETARIQNKEAVIGRPETPAFNTPPATNPEPKE